MKKNIALFVIVASIMIFASADVLNAFDPQKCPLDFVTVTEKDGKTEYTFGTTVMAYTPAGFHGLMEAYGLKITDHKKAPLDFVTAAEKEGKIEYTFGTTAMAYTPAQYNSLLEAYGVNIVK